MQTNNTNSAITQARMAYLAVQPFDPAKNAVMAENSNGDPAGFMIVEWRFRAWRSAAWFLFAATITTAIITLAATSGTYGWRTASDWIFVLAVAHAVMADAAMDAWRELRRQETVDAEPSI